MSDDKDAETPQRQWPVVIKLAYPISYGTEMIDSLTFRRGKMGDTKGLALATDRFPTNDQSMTMASRMCGQPLKVIELLDGDDWSEVYALVLDFFARSLGAGKTS